MLPTIKDATDRLRSLNKRRRHFNKEITLSRKEILNLQYNYAYPILYNLNFYMDPVIAIGEKGEPLKGTGSVDRTLRTRLPLRYLIFYFYKIM